MSFSCPLPQVSYWSLESHHQPQSRKQILMDRRGLFLSRPSSSLDPALRTHLCSFLYEETKCTHTQGPPQAQERGDRSGTLPLSAGSQRKTIPGLGVGEEREKQRRSAWHSSKCGCWAGHQQAGCQGWCTKPARGRHIPWRGIVFQDDELE